MAGHEALVSRYIPERLSMGLFNGRPFHSGRGAIQMSFQAYAEND
jgi:hypothetical protein